MGIETVKVQEVCPYTGQVVLRHYCLPILLPGLCERHVIPEKWLNESETDYQKRIEPFVLATTTPHRTQYIPG